MIKYGSRKKLTPAKENPYWLTFVEYATEHGYTKKVTGSTDYMNKEGKVIKLLSTAGGDITIQEQGKQPISILYSRI